MTAPTEDTPTVLGSSQDEATPTAQGHEADNFCEIGVCEWGEILEDPSPECSKAMCRIYHDQVTHNMPLGWMLPYEQEKEHLHHHIGYLADNFFANLEHQEKGTDMITPGLSQDTVIPSRPGEHKKQELEGLK